MSASPLILIVLSASLPSEVGDLKDGLSVIAERQLLSDVVELSSDKYMGRNCPTPGYMLAAEFVEKRFMELGLEPGGSDPDGEHPYFHYWTRKATLPDPTSGLALVLDSVAMDFQLERDWIPLAGSKAGTYAGELVYVGYAIRAPEWGYLDFEGLELAGKLAIGFWHEPRENQAGEAFEGRAWSEHASAFQKAKHAKELGARALILIQDPLHHPKHRPPLFQFPLFDGSNGGAKNLAPDLPVVFVSFAVGQALTGLDLGREHARIDADLLSENRVLAGRSAQLKLGFIKREIEVPNVIGIAPGTGRMDGVVVVAAHLDHAGAGDDGQIWSGADDNASGSSALLAVAAGLARAPARKDTFLIAMAAEEWGLWGSAAYTDDPHVSMESTDFMLNIDMVGRGEARDLAVMGLWDRPLLQRIVEDCAKLAGDGFAIDSVGGQDRWERSDQFNFHKHGVPALFISESGAKHADYHRPSDTSEKIDAGKLAFAARLAYAIVRSVADLDEALPRVQPSVR